MKSDKPVSRGINPHRRGRRPPSGLRSAELRVYWKLAMAFSLTNCFPLHTGYEYADIYALRDDLGKCRDEDFIELLPMVMMELILNSDKEYIDLVFEWLFVRCGDYHLEHYADYRQKDVYKWIEYSNARQKDLEYRYKDFTSPQCVAIRDWIVLADRYYDLKGQSVDMYEVADAYDYWDERSKSYR